jgi:hypothetical protein
MLEVDDTKKVNWARLTFDGIFAHLPHFTFFIAYLPYDHHMSVTHGVANMQSAKKSVANVQIPRHLITLWRA